MGMRAVPPHVLRERELMDSFRGIKKMSNKMSPDENLSPKEEQDLEQLTSLLQELFKDDPRASVFKSGEAGKGFGMGVLPALKLLMTAMTLNKNPDKKLDARESKELFMGLVMEIKKELEKDPKMKPILEKLMLNKELSKEETDQLKMKFNELMPIVSTVVKEIINKALDKERENSPEGSPQVMQLRAMLERAKMCDDAGNFLGLLDVVLAAGGDTSFNPSDLARTPYIEEEEKNHFGAAVCPSIGDHAPHLGK